MALGELVIFCPELFLPVESLRGRIVGEGLLREGGELAAQFVVIVPVTLPQSGHFGREQDRKRGQKHDRDSQTPVRHEEDDRDDGHLKEAREQDVHNAEDAVGHIADIVHHPVNDIAGRRFIHKGYGQAAKFLRKADPHARAVIAADDALQQIVFSVGQNGLEDVHAGQKEQTGQEAPGQIRCLFGRPVIEAVDGIAQKLRDRHRAADQHEADAGG